MFLKLNFDLKKKGKKLFLVSENFGPTLYIFWNTPETKEETLSTLIMSAPNFSFFLTTD
jgi:hypothetical protein